MEKKEKNCDPDSRADARAGDHWDHVAIDPVHRLVLSVQTGKRTLANTQSLVDDAKKRMGGRIPDLITTDEHARANALQPVQFYTCPLIWTRGDAYDSSAVALTEPKEEIHDHRPSGSLRLFPQPA